MADTDGHIRVLASEEARKIAAGEVVDRPASLVREFIDNAIDSGAANIDVRVDGGGIRCVEVSDDGSGMSRADLEVCCLAHATSKIRRLDDLERLSTLGFRGEALAAAAAVSRLEIVTSRDGREAWRLDAGPGEVEDALVGGLRTKGSSVRARDLFEALPARRNFLKREGSEAALCLQTFIDKALAYPDIAFRFIQDGKLRLFLPAATLIERFAAAALDGRDGGFLREIAASGKGFSIKIIIGGPELYRNDRRKQYIFANGRRINDFALLQAIEYGSRGCFPNGLHPIGAVFMDVDPARADFNIHPAKREARFADAPAIHSEITSALRSFFHHAVLKSEPEGASPLRHGLLAEGWGANEGRIENRAGRPHGEAERQSAALERVLSGEYGFAALPGRSDVRANRPDGTPTADSTPTDDAPIDGKPTAPTLRYAGRVFGLFILAEDGERLYIIDQHAAHERILYDRFLSANIERQELLVPIAFRTDSADEDEFLLSRKADLARLGVVIDGGNGEWRIEALPTLWRLGDGDTVREILALRSAGADIAERWAATLACHGAVRDGDWLDDESARALAERALALPVHRCPHGRPILTEIRRNDLLKAVQRAPVHPSPVSGERQSTSVH